MEMWKNGHGSTDRCPFPSGPAAFGQYLFRQYLFRQYLFGQYLFGQYLFGQYLFGQFPFGMCVSRILFVAHARERRGSEYLTP